MSGTWILACFVCLSLAVSGQVSNDTRAFPVGGTATLPCTGVPYDGATKHWEKNPVIPIKFLVVIQTPLGQSSYGDPFYDETNIEAAGLTGRFRVTEDLMTATITGVRATDDGDYRCASGPSQIIHKFVAYKLDSVGIQPSGPVTGYVGGTFDVTCTASRDSKPTPSFNWTKQGDSSFTATGATLRISSLTMNHAGTYVCTAYHAYARDTASVQLTVSEGPNVTPVPPTDMNYCSGAVAGAAVGCFFGGLLVGGAAVFLFLRSRTAKNGGKKDVGNFADRQYENVPHPNQRVTSQRPGSGSDEYEVPMETIQPPQPSDDYQELRPAVYQSLQKH
ncbi:PREDICTED: coxsackievirus and adenovirus receptor homolog isoform X1 [Branchiostoma belcheri]|uniref:Coxsackievirus and adenovirus receptor homolog isoform X1 n=1 Tax=Branchiostoma belcheri TaxID=7741 RepID=A0A6P4YLA5_BRABE|nr:PREDICTED: coxsackievirus and adenovirus receptor homolog isoform X1 [Branchiostoma belcheri]